jgi:hypothetical protein
MPSSAGQPGSGRRIPAAGRLRDAPVDREFPQNQSDDPVIGLAGDLLQLREDPGPDPLAAAPADGGGTARAVSYRLIRAAEPQHLDQLFENDPVGDPAAVEPSGWDGS